jgi:predicted enzyme related to lactoylglutathione lyase
MHGQFVWYELTTPDVDAARRFYPTITGWGTQQFDKDYTMWTSSGTPFAGIFKLGPEHRAQGIPPNWMPYVEAGNVDDTARGVTSLGGTVVVPPTDIPGTGRFAVAKDPQGATFGIYKSSTPGSRAWDGTPVLGRFSWHELMTTDYKRAFDFYRQLFGWEKISEMDMGPGGMYFMYGKGGKMYGGMYNRPPEMSGMPPFWLVYAHVKDVEKAVEAAKRAGGSVKQPPMDVPGGRIAVLGDPQGAGFAVHAVAAAVAAPAAKPAKPAAKPAAKKASKAASRPKARAAKSASKTRTAKSRPKAKAASRKRTAAKKSSGKGKAKAKAKRRK